jgi:predicted branched-subunit amino acid permease
MTVTTPPPTGTASVPGPSSASGPSSADLRRAAVRDIVALAPGIVPFGLMLGVTAVAMHVGGFTTTLGAVLVFGGSAQLTTMSLLHLGTGVTAALVSGAVVNARIMLYGAALASRFRDQPLWFRLLAPQLVQDQTYLSAIGRPEWTGAVFRRYWGWLGGTLLAVWTASVVLGVLVGPLVPPLPHLTLVGTALFVAMLAPKLVDRAAVLAAVTAGATAVLTAHLLPPVAIIAGTLAGLVVSMLLDGRRSS